LPPVILTTFRAWCVRSTPMFNDPSDRGAGLEFMAEELQRS
jgi:hypothetical protein